MDGGQELCFRDAGCSDGATIFVWKEDRRERGIAGRLLVKIERNSEEQREHFFSRLGEENQLKRTKISHSRL